MEKFNAFPNIGKQENTQTTFDFEREDTIKAALKANGLGFSLLADVYE